MQKTNSRTRFLNLGTTGILGEIIHHLGAVLCTVGYRLAVSLAPTYKMSVALPILTSNKHKCHQKFPSQMPSLQRDLPYPSSLNEFPYHPVVLYLLPCFTFFIVPISVTDYIFVLPVFCLFPSWKCKFHQSRDSVSSTQYPQGLAYNGPTEHSCWMNVVEWIHGHAKGFSYWRAEPAPLLQQPASLSISPWEAE